MVVSVEFVAARDGRPVPSDLPAHHLIRLHDLRVVPPDLNQPQFSFFSRET
jgi:hypothetical protein